MLHDYTKMMLRVDQVPEGVNLLEAFPRLKNYTEFIPEFPHLDKVIRYIVLCYDIGSPLQALDNLGQKKAEAAVAAGFPYKNEQFPIPVVDMMDGKVLEINLMIIRYCRMQQSRLYMLIVSGNEAFHEAAKNLIEGGDAIDALKDTKTKMEIFEKVKSSAASLDQMSRDFVSNDISINMQKTLYTVVYHSDEVKLKLTPEDYALI